MSVTMQTANEIFESHPTRFTKKEKQALRTTLRTKLQAMGYADSEMQEINASGTNFVVGDPCAEYLFTAHYDTPGRTGWLLGTARWLGQTGANLFFLVILFLLITFVLNVLSLLPGSSTIPDLDFWGTEGALLLMLAVMFGSMLIKNKNNRNDNTSGVLSLLSLAEKVSADPALRSKCCFIFFDNEEWGLLGSSGFADYAKKNGIDLKQTKVVNFDCVGNGDVLGVFSTKKTPVAEALADAFAASGEQPVKKHSRMIFLSDHANFKNSVMISYVQRSAIGLLYLPLIHTGKDTVCEVEQINRLTDKIYEFVKQEKI